MLHFKNVHKAALGAILASSAAVATATPVTGQIGFGGNSTIYTDTSMETVATDFTNGTVIDFVDDRALVAMDPTGAFADAGIEYGDLADTADYLVYDPANPANTNGQPLWSIGGFEFHLTDLSVLDFSANALFLQGTGYVAAEGYEDTAYNWAYSSQNGFTFSSASHPVPESSTLALLGLGLAGLGMSRLRKSA